MANITWLHTGTADRFDRAQFKFGVDGKPTGIEIRLEGGGENEGVIVLAKEQ